MSEQNQLPFLPAGWVIARLEEITLRIADGSHAPPPKQKSGFPMLSARNIEGGQIKFDNFRYISSKDFQVEDERTQVRPGDVLLTIVGTIGRTAVVPTGINPFALQRSVAVIKPIRILPKFLMHFFESPSTQKRLSELAKGTAQKGVYLNTLSDLELLVAPLAEQQRIVDEIEKQFSRLDAAVEMLRRVERNLEHLRAATLIAAVEGQLVPTEAELAHAEGLDYEPADVLLQRILHERHAKWEADQFAKMQEQGKTPKDDKWKDKYEEPTPPDTIGLSELPEGWMWISLDSVLTGITAGKSFKCAERPPAMDEVGVVKVSAVTWGKFDEEESKTCIDKSLIRSDFFIKEGDFLFSRANTIELVGACVIVGRIQKHLMLSDKILRFSFLIVPVKWLLFTLRSLHGRNEIESLATGNQESMRNIGQDRIRQIRIPLPPLAEQHRIVSEVERRISVIEELKTLVTNTLRRAAILRQKILRDAFAGKLVPQDLADEPAERLLERIRLEKAESEKLKKKPSRRATTKTSRKKPQARKRAMQELPPITKGGEEMDSKEPIRARDIKLIRLKLDGEYKALLDFDQTFRIEGETRSALSPVCLVGLNGSGKSNLIEALSEIFCYLELINLPYEGITQRAKQKELDFEIEYELPGKGSRSVRLIKISKQGNQPPTFIERVGDEEIQIAGDAAQLAVLPTSIIGYSSGLNETISIPYFKTKAFYSEDVRNRAFNISKRKQRTETFTESRTLFMDYDSNAAILIANYIFGSRNQLDLFRERIRVDDIASFDIVIRLKYGGNKTVKLTAELEGYIQKLRECATNKVEDADKQSTFSYEIDAETRQKFRDRFDSAKDFFIALYKLSLLNALALKGEDRRFYLRPDVKEGLLERPPTVSKGDKIFDIDRLKLKLTEPSKVIDYAGISDGEHQFIHIFGTVKLFDDPGTLFLFDEPETHFNPRWRREFVELLNGITSTAKQEFIISTHSPYVVSGCRKENVFKFERKGDRATCHPVDFETYGSSFEYLLTRLFDLDSLISKQAFEEMRDVIKSKDLDKLEAAVNDFGESFEKRFLFEEIARIKKRG